MPKHRNAVFQTRLDEELLLQAKSYAKAQGVSLGQIIRAFLRAFLSDPPTDVRTMFDVDAEIERADYRKVKRRPRFDRDGDE